MKPIIFSTEMVQAILAGNKTQTRRVIKPQPIPEPYANDSFGIPFWRWKDCRWIDGGLGFPASGIQDHAPHQPGDIVYVRETWTIEGPDAYPSYVYKADDGFYPDGGWRPSIHMPRAAARVFLRVTDVRVERVQDISEADAVAEGIAFYNPCETDIGSNAWEATTSKTKFCSLWDSINAKRGFGWAANPWVWVYTFERSEASGR